MYVYLFTDKTLNVAYQVLRLTEINKTISEFEEFTLKQKRKTK